MAYSGFFQDFLSVRTARRNGGIHTAESRLPVVAFPSLIGILATVLYGYAVEKPEMFNHHWAVSDCCSERRLWYLIVRS